MAHTNGPQSEFVDQLDLSLDGVFDLAISSVRLDDDNATFDDQQFPSRESPYFTVDLRCFCGSSETRRCSCTSTRSSAEPESRNWVVEDFNMPQLKTVKSDTAPNGKKGRRRQQNRAAQERYREKQQRVLAEATRRIELLKVELEKAHAERNQFKLMYEDVESQLSNLVSLMKQHRL